MQNSKIAMTRVVVFLLIVVVVVDDDDAYNYTILNCTHTPKRDVHNLLRKLIAKIGGLGE